jgi:hypothetical protein
MIVLLVMCFLAEYILNNVLHGMCKRSYIALVSLVQYRYEMHSSCAVVHFISIYALQCRAYMARLHCVQNVMYYIYSRTPIYRDARGKGFCPVNRGARYIGVIYR